jgi:hypothetical protein
MHDVTLAFIFIIYDAVLVQNDNIKQLRNMSKKTTEILDVVEMVPAAMLMCVIGTSSTE